MACAARSSRGGIARVASMVLLAAILPGCGTHTDGQGDGGDSGSDGGTGDDGGGGGSATLAESLEVDISQATAIAYVNSGSAVDAGGVLDLSDTHRRHPREGLGGLYVFTAEGEAIQVELAEAGSTTSGSVMEIYPTRDWIFLWAWGYEGSKPGEPGAKIPCNTVAIRRADGRLFCSDIGTYPLFEFSDLPVQQSQDGTMGVMTSRDAIGNTILYRLDFDPGNGPIATLIDEFVYARTFVLNADGDALVTYQTSPLDTALQSLIWPDARPPATEISGNNNTYLSSGEPGAVDENTFYVANGGNGMNFDNDILRVRKTVDGFVEEKIQLSVPLEAGPFAGLVRLSNGTYMIGYDLSLLRVVADGEVLPNETPIPIEGIDSFVMSSMFPAYVPGDGIVTIFGRSGESIVFVRHDGVTQVNLPVPDELSIQRVSFARSGAIEFIARDLATNEFVRGRFPAGSTALAVTPSDLLRPEDVVAFTALN